jgi:hypothetical protein
MSKVKAPAPEAAPTTVQFGRRRSIEDEPEVPVGSASRLPADNKPSAPPVNVVTLGTGPRAIFAVGPGRTGKTTLLRYLIEAMPADGTALAAALDPQNRSLATFMSGVHQPEATDPAGVARWAEELLGYVMAEKVSAFLDLGGGDLSFGKLLSDVPDLAGSLESAGVAPVALYTLSPRVDDLGVLDSYERQGFRPRATALILNAGLADPTAPPEDVFGRVLRHSVFRSAVERGAVPIWMPRLDAQVAADIEGKRLGFTRARDGITPEGQPGAILGPFARARVKKWLADMERAFSPLRSWFP